MCVAFIAVNCHDRFPLVVVHNRDESFLRPSSRLHWWEPKHHIVGGQDLKAGGGWFAANRLGRWAVITNYRHRDQAPGSLSRGDIVQDYLAGNLGPEAYLRQLEGRAHLYRGFNVLLGESAQAYYFGNRGGALRFLEPGIYGLSNALLDSPWPKVVDGKRRLSRLLNGEGLVNEKTLPSLLQAMMANTDLYENEPVPDTGFGEPFERAASPLHVSVPEMRYGTRETTVLMADIRGEVLLETWTYDESAKITDHRGEKFTLNL